MFRFGRCINCATGAAHGPVSAMKCQHNGSVFCDCPVDDCQNQRTMTRGLKVMGIATGMKIGAGTTLFTIGVEVVKYVPFGFEVASVMVASYLAFAYRTLRV